MAELHYHALIGDVRRSRDDPDRAGLQRRLEGALEEANVALAAHLVAPFALTGGDEFEALLAGGAAAVRALPLLADAVHPARLRFGLGRGPLATDLPVDPAARRVGALDGPCFHRARKAVQRAERLETWASLEGWGEPVGALAEALLEQLGLARDGWTAKQAQTITLARTLAQKDVAEALGVSPSVVSERLKAVAFDALLRAEDALAHALADDH